MAQRLHGSAPGLGEIEENVPETLGQHWSGIESALENRPCLSGLEIELLQPTRRIEDQQRSTRLEEQHGICSPSSTDREAIRHQALGHADLGIDAPDLPAGGPMSLWRRTPLNPVVAGGEDQLARGELRSESALEAIEHDVAITSPLGAEAQSQAFTAP